MVRSFLCKRCFCQLHDCSSTRIAWRRVNRTTIKENACLEMKNGISSGNFFRFVKSLFSCFRASSSHKIGQCCRQLHLKQINIYRFFVVPSRFKYVYAVSFAQNPFRTSRFHLSGSETVANKDDCDITLSWSVTAKRFGSLFTNDTRRCV